MYQSYNSFDNIHCGYTEAPGPFFSRSDKQYLSYKHHTPCLALQKQAFYPTVFVLLYQELYLRIL